jgi:hypothetical protein
MKRETICERFIECTHLRHEARNVEIARLAGVKPVTISHMGKKGLQGLVTEEDARASYTATKNYLFRCKLMYEKLEEEENTSSLFKEIFTATKVGTNTKAVKDEILV